MGLPWVRLDSNFASNPKVLALLSERDGHRAAFVYLCGLAYCGSHGTDGYVPRAALSLLFGRPKDAQLLTKYRLWHDQADGWQIHGWAEFQPSSEENRLRSESARRAACSRWHPEGCMCWKESGT